jgi:excisionase family DNA binding protein
MDRTPQALERPVKRTSAEGGEPETVHLLSVPETAKAINVCRATLYDLFRQGVIQSVKVGRRRLVKSTEVERYIASLPADDMAAKRSA